VTKVRKGPNCVSVGLAHDAFTGVKHSSTFSRLAQRRIAGFVGRQVVQVMCPAALCAEKGDPGLAGLAERG
jgi:hypothetical protein